MNYEANTFRWRKGDIVLHDGDAKEPKMLMVVIGYTRAGLCKTQYMDKRKRRTIYKNDIAYLHNPERFKLWQPFNVIAQEYLEHWQEEFELVRYWNNRYLPGTAVKTTSADGGFETITKGIAKLEYTQGHIYLERGGWWNIKFVEALVKLPRQDFSKEVHNITLQLF